MEQQEENLRKKFAEDFGWAADNPLRAKNYRQFRKTKRALMKMGYVYQFSFWQHFSKRESNREKYCRVEVMTNVQPTYDLIKDMRERILYVVAVRDFIILSYDAVTDELLLEGAWDN